MIVFSTLRQTVHGGEGGVYKWGGGRERMKKKMKKEGAWMAEEQKRGSRCGCGIGGVKPRVR